MYELYASSSTNREWWWWWWCSASCIETNCVQFQSPSIFSKMMMMIADEDEGGGNALSERERKTLKKDGTMVVSIGEPANCASI